MAELNIVSQPINAHTGLMKISGEVDSDNFEQLEDELSKLLENQVKGIAADFTELERISSAGLGAFVNLAMLLRDRKGKFIMVSPCPEIADLIDMLGIRDILNVVDKIDIARRELSAIR